MQVEQLLFSKDQNPKPACGISAQDEIAMPLLEEIAIPSETKFQHADYNFSLNAEVTVRNFSFTSICTMN